MCSSPMSILSTYLTFVDLATAQFFISVLFHTPSAFKKMRNEKLHCSVVLSSVSFTSIAELTFLYSWMLNALTRVQVVGVCPVVSTCLCLAFRKYFWDGFVFIWNFSQSLPSFCLLCVTLHSATVTFAIGDFSVVNNATDLLLATSEWTQW